jgi:hypothetical protein
LPLPGFLAIVFSGDGDIAYQIFLKPLCDVMNSAECRYMTFAQIVEATSSHNEFFVTDFPRFLKRLRNRHSIHPLTLHHRLTPGLAENLSKILPTENYLKPKSNGSQSKDAVALQVFTLEHLVTLLTNGNLHEALYFLPIVLWRVANQVLNITRERRIRFFGIAFEVGRKCADAYEHCGLPQCYGFGEKTDTQGSERL